MSETVNTQAVDLAGESYHVTLSELPSVCPYCHHSVHPKLLQAACSQSKGWVRATVRCTRPACTEVFFGKYQADASGIRHGSYTAVKFVGVTPTMAEAPDLPEQIKTLSPTFAEIASQVAEAETSQLDQLVGIGMRKALEFLVKDYAIAEHPDDAEKIKVANLSTCIRTYLADPNIKACAERAAWLGNDETHYVRKWTDKDVKDLRVLLKLTVGWIDNQLTTKAYLADMPAGKS